MVKFEFSSSLKSKIVIIFVSAGAIKVEKFKSKMNGITVKKLGNFNAGDPIKYE
jgi:hypothetical protein